MEPRIDVRETKDPALLSRKIARGVLLLVMVAVLAFVLLPMFWMVLTAFKTRGTAFRLAFVPETTLIHPPQEEAPFVLPVPGPETVWLHAEIDAPGAQSVLLEQRLVDGSIVEFPMRLLLGERWIVTVPVPFAEGASAIRARVNGQVRAFDNWAFGSAEPDADLFRTTPPLQPGTIVEATAGWLDYETKGDTVSLALTGAAPAGTALRRTTVVLEEFGDTVGKRDVFRLLQNRPFGEALGEMYTLENFRTILRSEDFDFGRFFVNSLIVATSAGLLTVFLCTMAGFAFATKRFHYREQIFRVLLASMLVPGMIFMVPQFSITLSLGWLNTYQGMVVPHLANVFGLFLLRQYIGQIPRDLFNAAEIDGARDHQVFVRIVMPICLPIMVTLFVLVFVGQWSNFLWQLIVNTGDTSTMTLPVGLQQFKGQNATEWELIMAGACFSLIPITILFFALQKYFLSGLTAGAVKE